MFCNGSDERGFDDGSSQFLHNWQVAGENFTLDIRYKVVDYLGAGAYGVVCAAHDTSENCMVAIKKCKKIFQSRTLAKRTLREIRLLRNLEHDNIIKVKTLLKPQDCYNFSDIYIVFEIMETDLAQIIRSPQSLKDQHVQYFTFQLLVALQYIHGSNVLHRDLKPRNLLVNADCCLKVADFGLARVYNECNSSKIVAMTEYVTTRWYRAPEILVGWGKYTSAVDMWAVGCIIAELIGRAPLFPGGDSFKQLYLICQCTGKPPPEFISNCRKENFRLFLADMPNDIKNMDLRSLYNEANPAALDLISKLLRVNPAERISAADALKHPYMQPVVNRLRLTRSEAIAPAIAINPSQFTFEDKKLTIDNLRDELIEEFRQFHLDSEIPYLSKDHKPVRDIADSGPTPAVDPDAANAGQSCAVNFCPSILRGSAAHTDDNSDYSIQSICPPTKACSHVHTQADGHGGIFVQQSDLPSTADLATEKNYLIESTHSVDGHSLVRSTANASLCPSSLPDLDASVGRQKSSSCTDAINCFPISCGGDSAYHANGNGPSSSGRSSRSASGRLQQQEKRLNYERKKVAEHLLPSQDVGLASAGNHYAGKSTRRPRMKVYAPPVQPQRSEMEQGESSRKQCIVS